MKIKKILRADITETIRHYVEHDTVKKIRRILLFRIKAVVAITIIVATIIISAALIYKHVDKEISAEEATTEVPQNTTLVDISTHAVSDLLV